jgi:hypothetical protein
MREVRAPLPLSHCSGTSMNGLYSQRNYPTPLCENGKKEKTKTIKEIRNCRKLSRGIINPSSDPLTKRCHIKDNSHAHVYGFLLPTRNDTI